MKIYESNIFAEAKIEANVIKNVRINGLVSSNGYTYAEAGLKAATPKYERADVYLDHDYSGKPRSIKEKIGYLEGVAFKPNGHWGDLVLNEKHPLYEQVLWWAEKAPDKMGLSHDVTGKMNKDTKVVEEIGKVNSVDLVSSPATTLGLHEEKQLDSVSSADSDDTTQTTESSAANPKKEAEMDWKAVTLDALKQNCPALVESIENAAKASLKDSHDTQLQAAIAREAKIQGELAKLPEKVKTPVFIKLIREAKDDASIDELVKALEGVAGIVPAKSRATGEKTEAEAGEEKKLTEAERVSKIFGIKESK